MILGCELHALDSMYFGVMDQRKKPGSLYFPSLDQVRNTHNYPRFFLNPMQNEKIIFLYFKRIQKVLTKTIPQM